MKPMKKRKPTELLLLSGLAGAGKSTALNILEDLGYFAVDNLPGALLPGFLDLLGGRSATSRPVKLALVMDARDRSFIRNFEKHFLILRQRRIRHRIVFFDARDDVLLRRYSETRRRHPLAPFERASVGILKERLLLAPVRAAADHVIDTTFDDLRAFRAKVLSLVRDRPSKDPERRLAVTLLSFGYRHGLPLEADLVLDMRSLPNPHFVPALRPLSGRNPRVARYVMGQRETKTLLKPIRALLKLLAERSVREGKSYWNIAFGCTGGRHRSVAIAEAVSRDLNRWGYPVKVVHRDVNRES
ncbi:MAG TPA: RNase adapter RapZ [bacterium]|nr:RNase adapter RapZ [bacterium]